MKLRSPFTAGASAALFVILGLVLPASAIAVERGRFTPKIAAADASGELQPGARGPSSNPLSGNSEAIDVGKQLFHTWCAQCHGPKADGGGQHKYAANLTTFPFGYKEFVATVKNGRVQKQMPPWKNVLDDDAINKIGAYLETLAQPGADWR